MTNTDKETVNPYREREYARSAREIACLLCDRFAQEIASMNPDHREWIAWEELLHEVDLRMQETIKEDHRKLGKI